MASRCRVQCGATSAGKGRIQLLHVPRRLCGACRYWSAANCGERNESEPPQRQMEQQRNGGGNQARGCGTHQRNATTRNPKQRSYCAATGCNGVPGRTGIPMLAAGKPKTDRAGTTNGGLCEQQTELRPQRIVVCSRTDCQSTTLLDAAVCERKTPRGLPNQGKTEAPLPDQRSHRDGCGNTHKQSGKDSAPGRLPAARPHKRAVSLWRGCRICWRHRKCSCRRRTLRRSLCGHHGITPKLSCNKKLTAQLFGVIRPVLKKP